MELWETFVKTALLIWQFDSLLYNRAIFSRAIADKLPKNSVIIMDKASYHNRCSAMFLNQQVVNKSCPHFTINLSHNWDNCCKFVTGHPL